jgi:hypothetical protein
MSILDLIRDKDGTMSHTKLWANVASGMACYQLYKSDSVEMVSLILGILILGRAVTKGMDVYSDTKANNA